MDGIPFNGPPPDFAAPPFKDLLNVYIKRAGGDRDQAFQRLLAVWEALKAQWRNGTIPFIVPQPSQWDHDLDLTPTRVHRHLVLTPVGSPLSSFRSQRELLHGLIAGLEIHEKLVATKGVLHKDITPHNMMYKDSKRGDRSVLLIDFDYAIPFSSTTQHLKGIGMSPYVSMSILRQATATRVKGQEDCEVIHEVADDLESFFYVFMWICILHWHAGSNGASCRGYYIRIGHGWVGASMTPRGLTRTLNAKNTFVHAPDGITEGQFTSYSKNLKPLAEEWRGFVKAEDERRKGLKQPHQDTLPSEPLTHQMIIKLLRRYADNFLVANPLPQTRPNSPQPPCLDTQQQECPPPSPSSSSSKKPWPGDDTVVSSVPK